MAARPAAKEIFSQVREIMTEHIDELERLNRLAKVHLRKAVLAWEDEVASTQAQYQKHIDTKVRDWAKAMGLTEDEINAEFNNNGRDEK